MSTLNVKNLPKEIHKLLKERAERHHRSLNREVVAILEQAAEEGSYPHPSDVPLQNATHETRAPYKASPASARSNRSELDVLVQRSKKNARSEEAIERAKREGRTVEEILRNPPKDSLLAKVRETRKLFKAPLTLAEINRAKRWGRP